MDDKTVLPTSSLLSLTKDVVFGLLFCFRLTTRWKRRRLSRRGYRRAGVESGATRRRRIGRTGGSSAADGRLAGRGARRRRKMRRHATVACAATGTGGCGCREGRCLLLLLSLNGRLMEKSESYFIGGHKHQFLQQRHGLFDSMESKKQDASLCSAQYDLRGGHPLSSTQSDSMEVLSMLITELQKTYQHFT